MKAAFFSSPARSLRPALIQHSFNFDGVLFRPPAGHADPVADCWLSNPLAFPGQESMVSLLSQIEDEGFAQLREQSLFLRWDSVYKLARSEGYRDSFSLLGLPKMLPWRPRLESRGGLEDKDFAILVAGWISPSGETVQEDLQLSGAAVIWKGEPSLLEKAAWRTVREIALFHRRWASERNPEANRRGWAEIRKHALAAKGELSNFLKHTVVLTPDNLTLTLRQTQVNGTTLIEVAPHFEAAPARWMEFFDRTKGVPERYDIPHGEGITQVVLGPEMQTVLREIKAMPGRRVAGPRAEAFVRNPFALLGPDATRVLDVSSFEDQREQARIAFARFTPELRRDADGRLVEVVLHIERSLQNPTNRRQLSFRAAGELAKFVRRLGDRIEQGAQCIVWEECELEILGETREHYEGLRQALAEWQNSHSLALADILDLSLYSGRIAGFGVEKPYYSPFIARLGTEANWFPDEISYGVGYQPENGGEPVAMMMSEDVLARLQTKVAEAQTTGAASVDFVGLPQAIPLKEAEAILAAFNDFKQDAIRQAIRFEKTKPVNGPIVRKQLIVRSNLDTIDYEERRGTLSVGGTEVRLPRALRPEARLKEHQVEGLRWLQNLWDHSPVSCRGALLADEMGLGKTVQLLAFVARCLEENPSVDPFLIVTPLSLVENWREEIDKFFAPGSLPVLMLYGSDLERKRVSRDALEAEFAQAGISSLLVRNWLGKAKVVLTTYETLRDLEFSLARQNWSAMICDEAQKIKNPNSLVSRAAKKQNARFKIACTATPVENSLTDLWCLFDFVQPGLLGALADFGHRYKRPIEAETSEEQVRIAELRCVIDPQMLRRTKAEVARDLPRKILPELCRKLPISSRQRNLYADALHRYRQATAIDGEQAARAFRLLHYLRDVCSDPGSLVKEAVDDVPLAELERLSPKLAWLLAELDRIRAREEKVIVFCEFRSLQRTLQREIGERFHVVPAIVNGQSSVVAGTPFNRQQVIRQFQQRPGFAVIILSPLVAGFGLNIQAANHVVHFTRSWNPAKEDQATDRAHRIGQTKDVYVYLPILTAPDFATFDAKLDELLKRKRELSREMLNGASEILAGEFGNLGG